MTDDLEKAEKTTWLKGLLVGCPMQKACDDCPSNELRKMPLSERMKHVTKMSDEEIDSMIEHHKKCIQKRESTS